MYPTFEQPVQGGREGGRIVAFFVALRSLFLITEPRGDSHALCLDSN